MSAKKTAEYWEYFDCKLGTFPTIGSLIYKIFIFTTAVKLNQKNDINYYIEAQFDSGVVPSVFIYTSFIFKVQLCLMYMIRTNSNLTNNTLTDHL